MKFNKHKITLLSLLILLTIAMAIVLIIQESNRKSNPCDRADLLDCSKLTDKETTLDCELMQRRIFSQCKAYQESEKRDSIVKFLHSDSFEAMICTYGDSTIAYRNEMSLYGGVNWILIYQTTNLSHSVKVIYPRVEIDDNTDFLSTSAYHTALLDNTYPIRHKAYRVVNLTTKETKTNKDEDHIEVYPKETYRIVFTFDTKPVLNHTLINTNVADYAYMNHNWSCTKVSYDSYKETFSLI